jgi:hypothetical protein
MTDDVKKSCADKKAHDRHRWWSRQHRMYFICGGRKAVTS